MQCNHAQDRKMESKILLSGVTIHYLYRAYQVFTSPQNRLYFAYHSFKLIFQRTIIMKKALLSLSILFTLISSTTAFADSGEIILRNGERGVRISIGNERMNERQLRQRIIRLEMAVRNLQNEVYNLQENTHPTPKWICQTRTSFGDIYFSDDKDSKAAAQREATKRCLNENNAMFCGTPTCSNE